VEADRNVTFEFLVTTLIVVVTPGTGVLYKVSAGLSRGFCASVIAAIGCTLGILAHMAAAVAGLATILQATNDCGWRPRQLVDQNRTRALSGLGQG
jgi:threonine/homoserine/homoserine lactone efflux protein